MSLPRLMPVHVPWTAPVLVFDPSLYKRKGGIKDKQYTLPAVTAPVQSNVWATPRHGCTSASKRLSWRTLRDLHTQVRFERCTPMRHTGVLNAAWVEWLMGYGEGWTTL